MDVRTVKTRLMDRRAKGSDSDDDEHRKGGCP